MVHSKRFSKIVGVLLSIVRSVKSRNLTIIQNISKNRSILMFLITGEGVTTFSNSSHDLCEQH